MEQRSEAGSAAGPARDREFKVGRNDPCPCGSGKKHKKCCLNKKSGTDLFYKRG
ncbi:MAG: SEC-C domain-containing protein [Proteobacteria bacterium]|nr:SEC-C domain-containing protein [Pseudomonadota bacterium]